MKKLMIAAAAVAMIASAQAKTADSLKADNAFFSTNAVITFKVSKVTDKWIATNNITVAASLDTTRGKATYKQVDFAKIGKTTYPQVDGVMYYQFGIGWTNEVYAAKVQIEPFDVAAKVFKQLSDGFDTYTNANKKVIVNISNQNIYSTALDKNGFIKNIKNTGDVGAKISLKTYANPTKVLDQIKRFRNKYGK